MKLLSILCCEKVIIDKNEAPTLILVMQSIQAQIVLPPNEPAPNLPANAVAPQNWALFTIWKFDDTEIGKTFRQRNEIEMPDKSIFPQLKGDLKFIAKKELNFNYVNFLGMPVGMTGMLRVHVWLEAEDGKEIFPRVQYPVNVSYVQPAFMQAGGQTPPM